MPTVSIILPTYNRARFLPQALESIRAQQWTDWELIIVDDGSTDETADIIGDLTAGIEQPVKFIQQENQGPAAARNRGIDEAVGQYVAFFDSDDKWLPHHLSTSVSTLEQYSAIDWVYAATKIVDFESKKVVNENCFYDQNQNPLPFMALKTERCGEYNRFIDDATVVEAFDSVLHAGLQTSVIRRAVFNEIKIPNYRVGEDQVFCILAMKHGFQLAWSESVHVEYSVHDESISAGATKSTNANIRACREFVRAFESLLHESTFCPEEIAALRKRLAREYFWNIGYRLQSRGEFPEARLMYLMALKYRPFSVTFWKTYFCSFLKQMSNTNLISSGNAADSKSCAVR